MNIGDKVKFLTGCAGTNFSAGTGDVVVVNTRNANWIEDQIRAGYAMVVGRAELEPASFRESEHENANPPVLPDDPKPQKRGGRRVVVSG